MSANSGKRPVSVNPTQIISVSIYPSIGIARVGNSVDENGWFYGPEVPGRFDEPEGGFKDAHGAVKRQAARFRVYAFDAQGGVLCEANQTNGFHLDWSIEIANQKAAWYTFMGKAPEAFQPGFTTLRNPTVQADLPPEQRTKLIVTSGTKTLGGINIHPVPLSGQFYGSQPDPTDVYLGEARTDSEGRLVVLAGRGLSRSIVDKNVPYPLILTDFDSADWIDDTSDGRIHVQVTHISSGRTFVVPHKARVIGTTPKFTSGIYAPTSLYDLMEDIYEREKRNKAGDKYDVGEVDWYRHIWPLLQRPALLSWVNSQANRGHGPNAPGNFFDEKWQRDLSDKSAKSKPIRQGVLGRMRLPVTEDNKYDQARSGQAYPYFMPWLSGDGGRTTAGDPSTFSSITELQYDRLVKWSKGDFVKNVTPPHPPPASIEELPLPLRPSALTKAALEPTIGAPLFPGIEMSWNAEDSNTYNLNKPFTIRDDASPGELTRYLSLPWQSDFYMCRNYWWPSARPDSVVPEKEYDERVARKVASGDIAKQLSHRVPWERGIHENYTDVFSSQPLFANTDMAQRWHLLGMVVPRPSDGPEPIFVETQRNLHKHTDTNLSYSPRTGIPHGGGINLPIPDSQEHPIQTVESLRIHLQTAMAVELSTIPLYLFGMYTVKSPKAFANDPRYDDPIVRAVRGVVAEEMLHLSLAGNTLRAVGGVPKLYDPDIIPCYPMLMPGRIPDLKLQLREMTKENLQTFIEVEKPKAVGAQPEPDKYHTLGQFYDAIKQGLIYLNNLNNELFHPETAAYQFAPGLGYQAKIRDAGGSVVVTDLASAIDAIKIIVDQGEGNCGEFDDQDHLEKDHYATFVDLQAGKTTWKTYPVRSNPKTYEYWKEDKRIYHVSLTFDAAYCLLLITIERLWTIKSDDARHKLILGNMFGIMIGVLAPLAKFLVQQRIGHDNHTAAPCFCYYRFDKGTSALTQVQREMQATIDAYLDVTAETSDQVAVHNFGPMLDVLLPIQQTISGLLDLDSFEKLDKPAVQKEPKGVYTGGGKGFARGF